MAVHRRQIEAGKRSLDFILTKHAALPQGLPARFTSERLRGSDVLQHRQWFFHKKQVFQGNLPRQLAAPSWTCQNMRRAGHRSPLRPASSLLLQPAVLRDDKFFQALGSNLGAVVKQAARDTAGFTVRTAADTHLPARRGSGPTLSGPQVSPLTQTNRPHS